MSNASKVILIVEAEDLKMELGGHGKINFFGVGDGHEVVKLIGEAEGVNGVLEELVGAMEVGELGGFGDNKVVRVEELGAEATDCNMENMDLREEGLCFLSFFNKIIY